MLVENIYKNPQNFQGTSQMQKEVPPSCKLQDYAHEKHNRLLHDDIPHSLRHC